eukprot:TRINITY_DN14393_c0_g1_i1.p1 TRINITY_DN14393_c0_g1~~TRINITY_DN14393_c0_g1_i1.p1  ORF type:complete len:1735 (-),score=585.53 TRINITY_DN14393_c0_g1_i1:78-5282(-)
MPPRKSVEDGEVTFHSTQTPLTTPLSFVSNNVLCFVAGNSVGLLNIVDGTKTYFHTSTYGITRLASCPAKGLLALCEGGTQPNVYVYSVEPVKLMFTLTGVTELELADLTFSHCGSRLYALSRATSKKLTAFSTVSGQRLPGAEVALPVRFDKVSVFPGHKDRIAVVRISSVRIVSLQKSYQTYIGKLQPSSIPTDFDITISAFAWAPSGHFLFATRQSALCTMDGQTGALLHICQAAQPITSITMSRTEMITVHIGNQINFWRHEAAALGPEAVASFESALQPMEGSLDGRPSLFNLQKSLDVQQLGVNMRHEQRLAGQIAHIQVTPNMEAAAFTTAEGEVWYMRLPEHTAERAEEGVDAEETYEFLRMKLLTWFHTHPVSDVVMLGHQGDVCASGDEGGRLRIWEVNRGPDAKGFRILRFTSAITSMTADAEGKLLFVGTDSGCVHALAVEDWRHARILSTMRVSDAGVMLLRSSTHTGRCVSLAAGLFNNKVACLNIMYREPKLRMCGFLEFGAAAQIEDLCYHHHDFKPESVVPAKLLVVGSAPAGGGGEQQQMSVLWYVKSPPLDYDPSIAELKRDVCPLWSQRLSNGEPGQRATAIASAGKAEIVIGFAGGAVGVFPPAQTQGLPSMKHAVTAPTKSLATHDQYVTALRVSLDSTSVLSASMDGMLKQTSIKDEKRIYQKLVHNPYNGGVATFSATEDARIIVSTGGSDGIMVWSDPASKTAMPGSPDCSLLPVDERLMDQAVLEVDDKNTAEFPVWAPVSAEEKAAQLAAEAGDDPELSAVATAQRKALMLEVDGLRKKLRGLVDANNICPDLEKIDRGRFCIDAEQAEVIASKTRDRCDALRAQLEKENMARQLTRDRLIKEFWDPMRHKGCLISSLMSNLQVSNYPERIVSEEETGTTRKLRLLRKVEKLEADMERDAALESDVILNADDFTTGDEQYIVNWWAAGAPKSPKKKGAPGASPTEGGGEAGEGEKEEGEGGGEEAGKEDAAKKAAAAAGKENEPEDQKYLYNPFELVTNTRRRFQIHLLQSLAADYRSSFNKLFSECQAVKKDTMATIQEKVKRMRAILAELQIKEEVPEPNVPDLEDPNSVLNVKDSEIKAEKFISEAEKKVMAEAAAKEAERLRQKQENDAGQRALMQMMGGTLKTKKDLSALEIVLDREPWMDEIPKDDMTEAQLTALAEFEAKEKALAEEQDKYKKQLDAEIKRLRQEIQECMQQFEVTLKELHHQRFTSDARFFCQELYCVRLQLALLQNVEDRHVLEQSTKDLQSGGSKLEAADKKLEAFKAQVQEKRERQNERIQQEREIASAQYFKGQFANSGLEPEQISALLPLFKRRRDARGAPGQTSGQVVADGEDGYPDLTTPQAEALASPDVIVDEVPLDECPDGIDEISFRRMNELRRERLHAEAEVQKGNGVLQEMGGLLAHFQRERDDAKAEHDQIHADLAEHGALMDRELYDIEILFKLRQGQVEVPQAAVVTDYSDAIVIDTEVVEKRNRRIQELGKDKIRILETTMEFRKQLNLILWEQRMLALQTQDLEERTKDVHMLRVTKDLQSLLKGGEEGRNKAEADLLERKIEHLNNNTAQKEASLKKQYASGYRATKLRKMENDMLDKKLRELQQNVIQREHIKRLRAPGGSGGGGGGAKDGEKPRIVGGGGRIEENEAVVRAAQAGFKEVRTRQALMDAAKKHTEEIDILNRELDRLRQRTFPSFVQLHEDRPANPDFRH